MTELEDLKKIWSGIDQKLDRNWKLNQEVLRKTILDKAQSKVTTLILLKSLALIFYMYVAYCFINFAIANWVVAHMAATGMAYACWTVAIFAVSIHELKLLVEIDYSLPVTSLQKQLVKIKLAIIRYLRIFVWIIPLNFGFIILFFKVLWNLDIVAIADSRWILANIVFSTVFFIPLSIWLHAKLNPENADKKWMNKLLVGNGSQVTAAINFLEEIKNFEFVGHEVAEEGLRAGDE